MLPAITDITTLSDEVKSGQVYGVVQLYKVLGDKPALEKKPRDVFARTYLLDPAICAQVETIVRQLLEGVMPE